MGAANGDDSKAAGDTDMADVDKEFYDPGEDEHGSTSSPQAGPSKKRRERGPTCFQSLQKLVQEPDRVKTCEIITETEVNGEKVSGRCGASLPLDDVHAAVCHWKVAHTKRGQRDNRRRLTCGWGGCTYQNLYTPLMRHVIDEHLAVRFKCPRCPYTTHRKDSLDNHRNAKNVGPLACAFRHTSTETDRVLFAALNLTEASLCRWSNAAPCMHFDRPRSVAVAVGVVYVVAPYG